MRLPEHGAQVPCLRPPRAQNPGSVAGRESHLHADYRLGLTSRRAASFPAVGRADPFGADRTEQEGRVEEGEAIAA